jgi:serine/threonine-protein kinase
MSLIPGARLGPYEIVGPIGAGGMGQVFRARDAALNRDVALKVLPELFASDPDRLARFTREAQTLAALNHPHIAAIYGIDQSTAVRALVMELVEGDDLSEQIARGPIPLSDALPMARQIADALEAAHDKGIIHRDLKPANIKVRADGTVKVLDFGLAKALAPAEDASASADNSPTLTGRATQLGMILGTAAYMAPEQAKGRAVDKRADIWAFGVVLYEMLTGRRAFKGDDVSETLASVLKDTPALGDLPAGTPSRLRELLARCLQKDPRQRQRDIGDVKLELEAMAAGRDASLPATGAGAGARPSAALFAAIVLAAAAIGIGIGWGLWRNTSAPSVTLTRFIVDGPGGQAFGPMLTPDGRVLIFATDRLYKRDLGAFSAEPLPGTEGANTPMISPDGRWVAFFVNGKVKKVSLSGGDPTTVAEVGSSMPGASWGLDDTIFFSRGWATGLSAIKIDDGQIRQLTEPDRALGERAHWRPRLLPGGQQALFTIWMAGSGVNDARVGLLDLKTLKHRALFPGTDATYLQSGHVLFFHAGVWHIVPFDASAGKTTGDPVTVLEDALGVPPDGGGSAHVLWVSETGTLAYQPDTGYSKRELVWIDRAGRIEPLGLPPHKMVDAALSPDGRRIAVGRVEGGTFELWMDDVARKTEERLDIKGSNFAAVWDPRGEKIAFVSERKGEYDTYTAQADGSNVQPLLTRDFDEQPLAWTHDGRRLIDKEWRPDGSTPVNVIDLNAGPDHNTEILVANSVGGNPSLSLSRDDKWLLFTRLAAGRREVYVQPFRASAASTRVSSKGGTDPLWSAAGSEIFFHHGDDVVSVSFRQDGEHAVIGSETVLFPLADSSSLCGIAPDGRFLVARLTDPEPPPGIRVVLNWFAELKGRGPSR